MTSMFDFTQDCVVSCVECFVLHGLSKGLIAETIVSITKVEHVDGEE